MWPPCAVVVRVSPAIACADEASPRACHAGASPKATPSAIATTPQKMPTRMSNIGTAAVGSKPAGIIESDPEDGCANNYSQCPSKQREHETLR